MTTPALFNIPRPAVRYHGGKFRLADWIVGHFGEHSVYVEPYCGGAGVLIQKPLSQTEIYNDLDSDAVNYFRVLRDPTTRDLLISQCALTPFSREEYYDCFQPCSEPVERARRFVSRAFMGFGSHSHNIQNNNNGFRTWGPSSNKNYAREWKGIPDNMLLVAERFKHVVIERLEALRCIAKYDGATTLFYVDPPYVRSLRDDTHKGYAHEMSDTDHRQLAWALHAVKGKVVLSGYPGALYDELYADWRREEKQTSGNGQTGSVSRTEVLWLNF